MANNIILTNKETDGIIMARNKQLTSMAAAIERALNDELIKRITAVKGISEEETSDIAFNVTCAMVAKLCALGAHEGNDKTKVLAEVFGVIDQQVDGWLKIFRNADEQDAKN